MKSFTGGLVAILLTLGATVTAAQESSVAVTRLTDRIYLLSTDQGNYTTNTIASVGDDGVLLVDAQAAADGPALREAVEAFGRGLPRYIINTHRHVEHVGGNAEFGDTPIVIAHELVPGKLRSGSYLFDEFPAATFPDITLCDSLTLYFNGERIRIIALPGSHDDNEIIVHFTDSKVVHLSSLVNGFTFPSIDGAGDVLMFERLVGRAIELLPPDVVIVSGHNDPGTWDDLHTYRTMLLETTAIVRDRLAAGYDLERLQEEGVLDAWDAFPTSYVNVDGWIEYLVDGLQETEEPLSAPFEALYYAWKDRGAVAAVAHYFELKSDHPDEYDFSGITLLVIGDKLLENDHTEAAITFLEASLEDHPDSRYGFYSNYRLAEAHDQLGATAEAVRYCERAVELNPDFAAAAALLERLQGG